MEARAYPEKWCQTPFSWKKGCLTPLFFGCRLLRIVVLDGAQEVLHAASQLTEEIGRNLVLPSRDPGVDLLGLGVHVDARVFVLFVLSGRSGRFGRSGGCSRVSVGLRRRLRARGVGFVAVSSAVFRDGSLESHPLPAVALEGGRGDDEAVERLESR